jgi:outer membrane lipoprotein carrier protein
MLFDKIYKMKKIHFEYIIRIFQTFVVGIVCLVVFIFLSFTFSYAISLDEDIKSIQDVYENIKDMSGSFIQKSYIKDLKRTDTYSGQFFIKQPMKVKWMYDGSVNQEVLINNDEIIIYHKKERQVFRSKFDENTYGRAPIALLSGFGQIQKEFSVSGKNRLLLKPKKKINSIKSIELELCQDKFPIRSFTIYDFHKNKIVITLEDVKINTELKDSMFEPSLPKDTTLFEHDF